MLIKNEALLKAVRENNLAQVQQCLQGEVDINAQDAFEYTALHYAAAGGYFKVVQFLLKYGADIHARNCSHSTALHYAAAGGDFKIVQSLLEYGADINARDCEGRSALHIAAEPKFIEYLLKHGANIEATDKQHRTPLHMHIAVRRGGFSSRIECLINSGADVNARDKQKRTALHWAAEAGHVEITASLLKHGAELCPDEHGKTPLYYFLVYYRAHTVNAAGNAAVLETIKRFLKLGDFLFQPLQIKPSQDAVPDSMRLYDYLPAVLQAPIKAHYQPLIEKALAENSHLKHTVEKLTAEQSRYVLAAAFIEAKQALPRLLKQPPVGVLQHLIAEMWVAYNNSLSPYGSGTNAASLAWVF